MPPITLELKDGTTRKVEPSYLGALAEAIRDGSSLTVRRYMSDVEERIDAADIARWSLDSRVRTGPDDIFPTTV